MAAAVSSPWGKPGAWALDAEEREAELQQQQPQQNSADLSAEFPSLAAATTKTKKKKGQTLSLAEFSSYSSAKPAPVTERLTPEELLVLPTGPRQRSAEELDSRSKLGGGFKDYGSRSRYGGEDDSNHRWGSSRFSEDVGRRGGGGFNRDARESAPSRADEIDNWAATKKPMVGSGFERRERCGFFESRHSKADEADNWVANKAPSLSGGANNGNRFERRGNFDSLPRNRDSLYSSSSDSDTWGRKKEENSGGSGGRPRLVLQPRTLPVLHGKKDSPVTAEKLNGGANPFGNARPREEVLAEKGQDWKEIDEKLENVKIKEVVNEKGDGSFGKRSFGLGKGRYDDGEERSWRKSPEKSMDGSTEDKKEAVEEADEHAAEEQN